MYREILTKAIIAKGEKVIDENVSINTNKNISKILGCWIINHKYDISHLNQKIYVKGSYDVFYWFGFDDNTNCGLANKTYEFNDEIPYTYTLEKILLSDKCEIKSSEECDPFCSSMTYENDIITISVKRKYLLDIIGETKIKVKVDDVIIDQTIDTEYFKDKK